MRPPSESRVFLGMAAVVASPAMRQLLAVVERVAQTPASVLIQGESGSGKELIARAIHHYSLRCSKPWVGRKFGSNSHGLLDAVLGGWRGTVINTMGSGLPVN